MSNEIISTVGKKSIFFILLFARTSHSDDISLKDIIFSPSGSELTARVYHPSNVGIMDQLGFFNVVTGKLIRKSNYYKEIYSPDSSYKIRSGNPMKLFTSEGKFIRSFSSDTRVSPAAISPDGNLVIAQGKSGWCGLWNTRTGEALSKWEAGVNSYPGLPFYFANDSRSFYASCEGAPTFYTVEGTDGRIYPRKVRSFGWSKTPYRAAFHVNFKDNLICTILSKPAQDVEKTSAQIILMNFEGKVLSTRSMSVYNDNNSVHANIRFSDDGRYVAIRDYGEILICSAPNLKLLNRYKPESFGLRAFDDIAFSPQGKSLIIGGWGKSTPIILRLP